MAMTSSEFKKIEVAIQWLSEQGYEDKLNVLRRDIAYLCKNIRANVYENTPAEKNHVRYVNETVIELDRIYFQTHGEHFCRKFLDGNRQDSLAFATEIIAALYYAGQLTMTK